MKKLFLLPVVALFSLVGCGQQGGGSGAGGKNDGKSEATAYTAAEAIALMDEAGNGVIVGKDQQYYVKGVVQTGSTVNTQYHQWYCFLDAAVGGKQFKISGATLPEGLNLAETNGALDGKTVIVKGFMELYNNEYKIGYLPAAASPTGAKFIPAIVSVK